MRIVVDQDLNANGDIVATHTLDTTPSASNNVQHPDGSGKLATIMEVLQHLNGKPDEIVKAGYAVTNQLPGEMNSMSRWQRIINAAYHPFADPALKALHLTPLPFDLEDVRPDQFKDFLSCQELMNQSNTQNIYTLSRVKCDELPEPPSPGTAHDDIEYCAKGGNPLAQPVMGLYYHFQAKLLLVSSGRLTDWLRPSQFPTE